MGSAFAPDSKEAVKKTAFERPAKDFKVWASSKSLGFDLPQRIGRVLWFPMLAMALMSFVVAWIFGVIRADEIAGGGNPDTIAAQGHLVPAFMFLGFASVFAAISFAIARILGTFRNGGGEVQEAAQAHEVQTLSRPWTAWVFIGGMMMAMMAILLGVVIHFIAAGAIASDAARVARSDQWFAWAEAIRRLGIVMYLTSIAFGLATIIQILRFQSVRVRELPSEGAPDTSAASTS